MTRTFAALGASVFLLVGCGQSVSDPAAVPAASATGQQREQPSGRPQSECDKKKCPNAGAAKGEGPFKRSSNDDALVTNPGGAPPPMTLVVDGERVKDQVGTYCSSGNGQGICVDGVGASGPTVLLAAGPQEFSFDWRWRVKVLHATLCLERSFDDCARSKKLHLRERWMTRFRPGTYMVSAFARWDGGDASYEWFLEVD